MAAMESGGAWGLSAITNYGWLKFATLGAAGLGALLMAVARPPKSRKEMMLQAFVALGTSFLFGDLLWQATLHYVPFLDDRIAAHGLTGALSWGAFGGLAHFRDKLGSKSIDETVSDIRKL